MKQRIEMPDESCRSCGGELRKSSLCAECRRVIQHICIKCGLKTEEHVHSNCFYEIELLQTEDRVVQAEQINFL
ncbi:MAG: hypothetical protein ACREAG_00690 [Nitrosopumilaceae archaeon]